MRGLSFSALAIAIILMLNSAVFSGQQSAARAHPALQASGPYSYVVDGGFESYESYIWWSGSYTTSSLHKVSGGAALNFNTQVEEYTFIYQFLSCNESTYRFVFWIYQASAYGGTYVMVTPLHPWLEEGTWTHQASVFIIRNGSVLVDAWRTTQESDPPLKTLNCNFSLKTWHKIVFDADGVSKTQKVYVDDNLTTTLTSSSGTVFAPEILFIGDISNTAGFGDFYYDDVDLLADVSVLTVSIYPSSITISPNQARALYAIARGGKQPYGYQWYVNDAPAGTGSILPYLATSYDTKTIRVNVTDAEGKSQTAQAIVNPQPFRVYVTPVQSSVDVNHSETFSADVYGGVPPYSYQWYLNNTPVSGASESSWSFTPTALGKYNIYVSVTDSNNTCILSSYATLEAPRARLRIASLLAI